MHIPRFGGISQDGSGLHDATHDNRIVVCYAVNCAFRKHTLTKENNLIIGCNFIDALFCFTFHNHNNGLSNKY